MESSGNKKNLLYIKREAEEAEDQTKNFNIQLIDMPEREREQRKQREENRKKQKNISSSKDIDLQIERAQ